MYLHLFRSVWALWINQLKFLLWTQWNVWLHWQICVVNTTAWQEALCLLQSMLWNKPSQNHLYRKLWKSVIQMDNLCVLPLVLYSNGPVGIDREATALEGPKESTGRCNHSVYHVRVHWEFRPSQRDTPERAVGGSVLMSHWWHCSNTRGGKGGKAEGR